MQIGVSLSLAFLCGRAESAHQRRMLEAFGGAGGLLGRLHAAGADYIELRAVRPDTKADDVKGALCAAREHGFSLTVHGQLADEPAEAFWERLRPVLDAQPRLTVTVHSAKDREETLGLLNRMAEYAQEKRLEARLALENNRSKKGDNIDLVECSGVVKTLRALERTDVGACWDFGHFYWDRLTHPGLVDSDLPEEEFLRRTIHTHIHSVMGDTTHFPLTTGQLPLKEYLAALAGAGYQGVLNLEPEPERWSESVDAAEEIVRSVGVLKRAAGEISSCPPA